MKLIDLSVKQPISVIVAILFTFLAGLVAIRLVAVEMTPEVEDTIVAVTTFWENASPQEIESEVVDSQEEKLQSLSNLRSITSESSQGQGLIRLEFNTGVDKNIALRDVSDKLREVPSYPFGVDEPVITASDPESQDYIAWYILTTDDPTYDVRKLQSFSEDQLKPILERIPGISEVNALGGVEKEIQIKVDIERLAQYGITLAQLTQKLRESNVNSSAGALELGRLNIRLRSVGRFDSPESVKSLVLRNNPKSGIVKVGDVATVKEDFKEANTFVRASGQRAIAFNFQRESGSNVLDIMQALKNKIEEFNKPGQILETEAKRLGLNGKLNMKLSYDATRYVSQALVQVENNIYIGGALAIAVLLLFLRSVRSLGIIAISIPVSMVGAVVIMVALGRTVNVISLAGIAFAVGMVVDNSIVVLENIYRHLEMGKNKIKAAIDGSSEVAGAVLASSLTTLIVFIPILLITDQVGQLFRDISLAIMTAVAFSYLVAVTVIPAVSAKMLNQKKYAGRLESIGKKSLYEKVLASILNSNIVKLLVVVFMALGSILGAYILMPPMDYLPKGNRNITFGLMLTPPGLSLSQLEEMGGRVEEEIRPYWEDHPNRKPIKEAYTGREVYPTSMTEYFLVATGGIMFHGGISSDDRHAVDNVALLQHATRAEVLPGVFGFAFQFPLFRLGGSTGSAVKINLVGRDLDQVSASAGALFMTLFQKYGPGSVRPDPSNFNLKVQEVQLKIKEEAIVRVGLSRKDVVLAMQAAGDGVFLGEYEFEGDLVDLKIWSHKSQEKSAITDLESVPIATPDGRIMRLGQLANVVWTEAAEKIKRVGRRRAVTLEFTAPPGMPLEKVVDDLNAEIDTLRKGGAISHSVNSEIEGSAGKLLDIRNALLGDGTFMGLFSSSMFTSFVAVYLLMCILFQSWFKPLVIMFTVPLATFGGFLGLALVHNWSVSDPYMPIQNLDVLTLLGFVILSGVVVNNAILIVAQADILIKKGELSLIEAIAKASQSRVRPIFMSLLTSVGGMLPLILNPGAGSELYRGLGAVVVGGMLLSTLFTLVLIPVLLSFAEQFRRLSKKVLPLGTASLLIFLVGCQDQATNDLVVLSKQDIPKQYQNSSSKTPMKMEWWDDFNDSLLSELIDKALKEELTTKIYLKRIESVMALLGQIKAGSYPHIEGRVLSSREKIPSFGIPIRNNNTAGLHLQYNFDWLGRLRNEKQIASSRVSTIKSEYNAHRLKLISRVIQHYLSYRNYMSRIESLENSLKIQGQLIAYLKNRAKFGLSEKAIIHLAEVELTERLNTIDQYKSFSKIELMALERWVGMAPGVLKEFVPVAGGASGLSELSIGTPQDLIDQRSDIKIARYQVIAKAAQLNLTKKEIWPKIQFGTELSFYGENFSNWLKSDNSGFSFGPRLSWRLLEFGKLKNEKRAAIADYDEAVLNWRLTVRKALLDIETQHSLYRKDKLNLSHYQNAHKSLRAFDREKENLYKYSRIDALEYYQAKLKLIDHNIVLLQAQLNKTLSQIELYKIVGLNLRPKISRTSIPKITPTKPETIEINFDISKKKKNDAVIFNAGDLILNR